MNNMTFKVKVCLIILLLAFASCSIPDNQTKNENRYLPEVFNSQLKDTTNISDLNWKNYFADSNLIALIDTALINNQEFNIVKQEIEIAKNEILARRGEYLPSVKLRAGGDYTKESANTSIAAVKESISDAEKKNVILSNSNFNIGAVATWEIDVWRKLRNAKDAAEMILLANNESKNFLQTNLVAEIAYSYYELTALDNLIEIINQNVAYQTDALKSVKLQKESAKVTELAVNRFEAQLLNTQNLQFEIRQRIKETENKIHYLTGVFPRNINRNSNNFLDVKMDSLQTGVPSQLLLNRPDIKKAEFELLASKLNIEVAKANFYPTLGISAGVGFEAFNPAFLVNPTSIIFNTAGDLLAPLVNLNSIIATYNTATAQQVQAAYSYEQSILNAYTDVLNQLAKNENYRKSFETKNKEVEILNKSVTIANSLFNSARADYVEVLLTQEEVLKSKMELVEIKLMQLNAKVNLYRALGGGWK